MADLGVAHNYVFLKYIKNFRRREKMGLTLELLTKERGILQVILADGIVMESTRMVQALVNISIGNAKPILFPAVKKLPCYLVFGMP